jgi:monovalent cation:H+ antiporter-2, CPA2 family
VALAVAHAAHAEAPSLRIVTRAATWDGARRLKAAGVAQVVRPELEGGVEIVRRTLLQLDLPSAEVQRYADLIRREGLDDADGTSKEIERVLDELRRPTGPSAPSDPF